MVLLVTWLIHNQIVVRNSIVVGAHHGELFVDT